MVRFWDYQREGFGFERAAIAAVVRMFRLVARFKALTTEEKNREINRLGGLAFGAENHWCNDNQWMEVMILLGTLGPNDRHYQTSKELYRRIATHLGLLDVYEAVYGDQPRTCEIC